jgi:hypothetical protein
VIYSLAINPNYLRANLEWRPKVSSFANGAIAYSPNFYTKTIWLLTGIPINSQRGPRKVEPKPCNN